MMRKKLAAVFTAVSVVVSSAWTVRLQTVSSRRVFAAAVAEESQRESQETQSLQKEAVAETEVITETQTEKERETGKEKAKTEDKLQEENRSAEKQTEERHSVEKQIEEKQTEEKQTEDTRPEEEHTEEKCTEKLNTEEKTGKMLPEGSAGSEDAIKTDIENTVLLSSGNDSSLVTGTEYSENTEGKEGQETPENITEAEAYNLQDHPEGTDETAVYGSAGGTDVPEIPGFPEDSKINAAEKNSVKPEETAASENTGDRETADGSDSSGSDLKVYAIDGDQYSLQIVAKERLQKGSCVSISAVPAEGYRITGIAACYLTDEMAFISDADPDTFLGEELPLDDISMHENVLEASFVMPQGNVLVFANAETKQMSGTAFRSVGVGSAVKKVTFEGSITACAYPAKFTRINCVTYTKRFKVTFSDGTDSDYYIGYCLQADGRLGTYENGEKKVSDIKSAGKAYQRLIKALYLLNISPESEMEGGLWGTKVYDKNGNEIDFKKIFREDNGLTAYQSYAMAHVVMSRCYYEVYKEEHDGEEPGWTWDGGGNPVGGIGYTNVLNSDGNQFVNDIISLIDSVPLPDARLMRGGRASSSFRAGEVSWNGKALVSPSFTWSSYPDNAIRFQQIPAGITIVNENTGKTTGKISGGESFHIEADPAFSGRHLALTSQAAIMSSANAFLTKGGSNNQDLGFVVSTTTDPVSLSGDFPVGSLKVIKKAADDVWAKSHSIDGAIYTIYTDDGSVYASCTISKGEASVGNIPAGSYTCKETKPSPGYAADPAVFSFTVAGGGVCDFTFRSVEPTPLGTIKIRKSAEALADGSVMIQGIRFRLIPKDPNLSVVDLPETDSGGVTSATVPVGEWTLQEVSVPAYYDRIADVKVNVSEGKITEVPYDLTYNHLVRRKLRLYKYDADTGSALPGAHFRITDMTGNVYIAPLAHGRTDTEDESIYITDENGIIEFSEKLPAGQYTVTEVRPPYGYAAGEERSFEINALRADETIVLEIADPPLLMPVRVTKIDEETGNRCADGYSFEVVVREDILDGFGQIRSQDGVLLEKGAVADVITTDETSVAMSRPLYYGEYTIRETAVNQELGLAVTDKSYDVTVGGETDSEHAEMIVADLEIPDPVTQLQLYKTDETDETRPLAGISFLIRQVKDDEEADDNKAGDDKADDKKADETVLTGKKAEKKEMYDKAEKKTGLNQDIYVTDESGMIEVKYLKADTTYEIQEIETLPGYLLDQRKHYFYVDENGLIDGSPVHKIRLVNQPHIVEISKRDRLTGKELKGACLKVYAEDGMLFEEWITGYDAEGKELSGETGDPLPHMIREIPEGKYTLTEEYAPEGYKLAEPVTFEVSDSNRGELLSVIMYDEPETPPPDIVEKPDVPLKKTPDKPVTVPKKPEVVNPPGTPRVVKKPVPPEVSRAVRTGDPSLVWEYLLIMSISALAVFFMVFTVIRSKRNR